MSTKTLRKRIALVAVSALGAGLLSVVAVPSANATAPVAQRYEANVVGNSTNGVAGVSTGTLTGSAGVGSVGRLGLAGTDTTQTAVLLSTGTLSAVLAAYSGESVTASVTGGTFTGVGVGGGCAAGATITAPANTSAKCTTAGGSIAVLAKPNSGATSMVVTMSTVSDAGVSTTRARITTTIVATSAYNAYSPTYSTVYWGDGSTYTATTDATASNSNKAAEGVVSGKITLTDAYGNLLTASNTSLVTVSATGGALVKLGSLTTAGDRDSDYTTLSAAAIEFNVQQEDTDVPLNSTVTISVGGTVVATKTLVITGEVAKVTAQLPKIGKVGGSNVDAALITYEDSKGNRVFPARGTSVVSSTLGSVVTGASVAAYSTGLTDNLGYTALAVTCALGGTQKGLQVSHLNGSGTVVKSNAWDAGCATTPYSMTASWDKASYKRGEVATLTLSVKDSKGNAANAYDVINTLAADLTFANVPGTIVTAVADGDKPKYSTGAKTYQWTVTADDGDYQTIVTPATIKASNALQSNITVPFSVTSAAGVTNADVLKAIVSLIASINKQIAALQKALLKK